MTPKGNANKSLPPNDFGTSVLAENTQKVSITDVVQQYQQQWRKELAAATVKIMDTTVTFTPSRMNHGGIRLWFSCPQCNRRCGVLFQHPISADISCRHCTGIKYGKSRYKNMIENQVMGP